MSMWFARYSWLFALVTVALLGFAYYRTYRGRKHGGPWSRRILYATTVMSLGMISYTLYFNS